LLGRIISQSTAHIATSKSLVSELPDEREVCVLWKDRISPSCVGRLFLLFSQLFGIAQILQR